MSNNHLTAPFWAETFLKKPDTNKEELAFLANAIESDQDFFVSRIRNCYKYLKDAEEANRRHNQEGFDLDYALKIYNIWLGEFLETPAEPTQEKEE